MIALRNLLIALALLWAGSAEAALRFAVCTTTCTWDNSSQAMWSNTSGGATSCGANCTPPVSTDDVTLDAATCVGGTTCTITVNANLAVASIAMGACTASTAGCILDFSANNNNITISGTGGYVNNGAGTRTLNMGNGLWDFTNAIASFNLVASSSFNANSSTLRFSASGLQGDFRGGAKTFNVFTVTGVGFVATQATNVITTFSVAAGNTISFTSGTTQTITNAINFVGTSTSPITLMSSSLSAAATLNTASGSTVTWGALRRMTFTGTAPTVTNSLDLGNNTGVTISPPSGGSGGGRIIGGSLAPDKLPANDNLVCEGFVGRLPLRWGWKKCA